VVDNSGRALHIENAARWDGRDVGRLIDACGLRAQPAPIVLLRDEWQRKYLGRLPFGGRGLVDVLAFGAAAAVAGGILGSLLGGAIEGTLATRPSDSAASFIAGSAVITGLALGVLSGATGAVLATRRPVIPSATQLHTLYERYRRAGWRGLVYPSLLASVGLAGGLAGWLSILQVLLGNPDEAVTAGAGGSLLTAVAAGWLGLWFALRHSSTNHSDAESIDSEPHATRTQ
jgi:hypothetical protein